MLDDTVADYLYSDEDLNRRINNAVREVCLRTRVLQDATSSACSVTLVVGQSSYKLASNIMVVRGVFVPTRRDGMKLVTSGRLDKLHPGWSHFDPHNGIPEFAVFDVGQKRITLYPAPAAVGTMKLRIWRTPNDAELMTKDSHVPIVALPDPEEMMNWAAYESYLTKDGEEGDDKRAGAHLALFDARYGPRPTAAELQNWSTSPLVHSRMSSEF